MKVFDQDVKPPAFSKEDEGVMGFYREENSWSPVKRIIPAGISSEGF